MSASHVKDQKFEFQTSSKQESTRGTNFLPTVLITLSFLGKMANLPVPFTPHPTPLPPIDKVNVTQVTLTPPPSFNSVIQCTRNPDTCPPPRICKEIHNATGQVISSSCGCLNYYAFTGPQCVTPSSDTLGPTIFFAMNATFLTLALIYGIWALRKHIFVRSNFSLHGRMNSGLLAGVCGILADALLIISDFLGEAEVAHPSKVKNSFSGNRVTYLFEPRTIAFSVGIMLMACGVVLVLGVVYEYGFHVKFRKSREFLSGIRNLTFLLMTEVLVVGSILIGVNDIQSFTNFFAAIFAICWTFIMSSVIVISRELIFHKEYYSDKYIHIARNLRKRMMPFFLGGIFMTTGLIILGQFKDIENADFLSSFLGTTFSLLGSLPTGVVLMNFGMASVSSPNLAKISEFQTKIGQLASGVYHGLV